MNQLPSNPRWYNIPGFTPEQAEKREIENHIALWRRLRMILKNLIATNYASVFADEELFYDNDGLPLDTISILQGDVDEFINRKSLPSFHHATVQEKMIPRIEEIIAEWQNVWDTREQQGWERENTPEEFEYMHGKHNIVRMNVH